MKSFTFDSEGNLLSDSVSIGYEVLKESRNRYQYRKYDDGYTEWYKSYEYPAGYNNVKFHRINEYFVPEIVKAKLLLLL